MKRENVLREEQPPWKQAQNKTPGTTMISVIKAYINLFYCLSEEMM